MNCIKESTINTRMDLMSCIGILLVVCGHQNCSALNLGDLFPYYSYHLPLFTFISGYFYSENAEKSPIHYLYKKFFNLVVYYLFWVLVYAFLSIILKSLTNGAFQLGPSLSVDAILIKPLSGFVGPAWYLVNLFIVVFLNCFLRLCFKYLGIQNEWFNSVISLIVGILSLYIMNSNTYSWPALRIFQTTYLFPFFQFGQLYKKNLEKRDTSTNAVYFTILFTVQTVLILLNPDRIVPSVAHMTGFSQPLLCFVGGITGIALVLRVSRILDPVIGKSSVVLWVGRNTKTIMTHHMFWYFVLHCVFFIPSIANLAGKPDLSKLYTSTYYHYYPFNLSNLSLIYVILTIFLPLLFLYMGKKVKIIMNHTKNKVIQYLREFWKFRDLLKLLITKNIKLKYRRSWLGYVWSILNPLMIMAVMTVVFSTMFKRNIENFPVYLFCGQLLFNFMNTATTQSQSSITGNAALLKKTYVPKYLFTLAKVTSCLVDLLFSLGALVLVILITRARITWYALLFPFVLLQLYVFCVGLGLFLAQASVFFKDTQFIYSAVTTAWMYLSAIFYPIESLSQELSWVIRHFNPMYFYIGQFRDLVYYGRMPGHLIILAGCGAAIAMLAIGMWSFLRSKDRFILYI